jgi:small-conductance mechanosensitive channel
MTSFSDPLIGEITIYNLVTIAVIMVTSIIVAKLVTNHIKKRFSDKVGKDELAIIVRVSYYGIIILGFFIALPYFRVDLSGLLVAGGVVGIIIGFACQSVVSNLISGIFIIVERPVKLGDNINIGDVFGTVEEIRVLSTTVSATDGTYIRIPNEKVFTSNITNYVTHAARRIEYTIGIDYADDAVRGVSVINDLLTSHPFVLKNPKPQVFVKELSPDAVNISILFWTPSSEYGDVRNEMLWRIKVALDEAGLSFGSPRRMVRFGNELRMERRLPAEGRKNPED